MFPRVNARANLAQCWGWEHLDVSVWYNPPLKMSGSRHSCYMGTCLIFSNRFRLVNARANLAKFWSWGAFRCVRLVQPTNENV